MLIQYQFIVHKYISCYFSLPESGINVRICRGHSKKRREMSMQQQRAIDAARVSMRLECATWESTLSYFEIPACVAARCAIFTLLGTIPILCFGVLHHPETIWTRCIVNLISILLLMPFFYFISCGILLVSSAKKIAHGGVMHWFTRWYTKGIDFLVHHRIDYRGVAHACALCGLGITLCIREDVWSALAGYFGGFIIGDFVALWYLRLFRFLSEKTQASFALMTVGVSDEKLVKLEDLLLKHLETHYKS